jgi:hypothetical protein
MRKEFTMRDRMIKIMVGVTVLALAQIACSFGASKATPTPAVEEATVAVATTAPSGNCPALNTSAPQPSGFVTKVTMAEDTQGDQRDPVNPTVVFSDSATFHAVVTSKDAPTDTVFKTVWYAVDTNGAVDCNTKIDEYELKADGSRNIDFTLSPKKTWPAGSYAVQIFVNDTLDQVSYFTVK